MAQRQFNLTERQKRVAEMLALGDPETGDFYPKTKVCELTKTPRSTLYDWLNNNADFNDYIQFIASETQRTRLGEYYKQLDKVIFESDNDHAILKGIELVLKRIGLLQNNSKVELDVNGGKGIEDMSNDEIDAMIKKVRADSEA